MTAILDWISNVPPVTIEQWIVCVLPVVIGFILAGLLPIWPRRS